MRGFADSLNLSVAAALCIQTLFHLCPEAVGARNSPSCERSGSRRGVTTRGQDRDLRDKRTRLTRVRKKLLKAETAPRADPNPNGVGGRVADLAFEETQLCGRRSRPMEETRARRGEQGDPAVPGEPAGAAEEYASPR